MITVLSTLAFILVAIGVYGSKYHYSYGQKCLFTSQILWLVVGSLQNNYVLVAQSVYLFCIAWSTDRLWSDKGYYGKTRV